jgi:nucleotide-binding universal stress UspA family protein
MFKRILVAVEPTLGNTLMPQAIAIAQVHQAQLLVLHVFSAFEDGYAGSFYPGFDGLYPSLHAPILQSYAEASDQAEAHDSLWLQQLAQTATAAGIPNAYRQVRGLPGQSICDCAVNWQADLILVGRRGRSGLSELLLGSVSNHVTHHAPCAVLTLQPPTPSTEKNEATKTLVTS